MKYQPSHGGNDVIYTPRPLAKRIIKHLEPRGKILEPAAGEGAFLDYLPEADWCEISKGKDFFDYQTKVDWIITNPPWSQIRRFLRHALKLAKHVVFLFTLNHLWTKARWNLIRDAGFGIREIILLDTPTNFPPSGFQLGVIHLESKYTGATSIIDWTIPKEWWDI